MEAGGGRVGWIANHRTISHISTTITATIAIIGRDGLTPRHGRPALVESVAQLLQVHHVSNRREPIQRLLPRKRGDGGNGVRSRWADGPGNIPRGLVDVAAARPRRILRGPSGLKGAATLLGNDRGGGSGQRAAAALGYRGGLA